MHYQEDGRHIPFHDGHMSAVQLEAQILLAAWETLAPFIVPSDRCMQHHLITTSIHKTKAAFDATGIYNTFLRALLCSQGIW